MGRLRISPPLLTGHDGIDKEHKELAALVNEGKQAVEEGALETCAGTLQTLVEKLEQHFLNEERIMLELGYPEVSGHAAHHRDCMTRVKKLQGPCRNPDCWNDECVLKILSIVLDDIVNLDLGFKSYLQGIDDLT